MATYTIRPGDTLGALARRYNTSVDALAKANNLQDPNRIVAGQTLTIPDGFDGPRQSPASSPGSSPDRFEASAPSGGRAASGTTNTNAWIPVDAPVRGDPSNRNASNYSNVINQFAVDTNPRYQPRGGNTYCNIFAWDVTRAMGAEIPHWVDGNGNPAGVGAPGARELDANGGNRWLETQGPRFGWREVSAAEAQQLANQGHPAVASWNNPGGIGHIAVVRPGELTNRGPAIAQAGASNFNNGHVQDSFGNRPVQYFVNDSGQSSQPSTPAPSAPPPPSTPAPSLSAGSYTVQPGDTLSGIASRHGTTVDAIAQANGISNPNFIQVGQQLSIPGAGGPSQPTRSSGSYTVQPGDTLSGIASRYGTTVSAIAQANGISNPNLIQVGQRLTIPGAGGPSAPSSPPPQASQSYTVQPGDTLSGIASRYGTTVSAIAQANGISNPNLIQVGQRLTIPGASGPSAPTPPPPQASQSYTVQPGDTLSGIASRFGSTVSAIAQANGISNPNLIQVGQRLTIPGASGPSAPTPPPPQASQSYTVQPGDTLSGIAARFGSTVSAIAQANGIANPNLIQVGQRLTIPGGGSAPGPVSGPGPVTPPPGPTTGGVSVQQLRSIMPNLSEAKAQQYLPYLNAAMAEAGINTPRREAAFLAQLAHESGEFRYMEEIASGAAYEGRTDLGNTQPGDGVRYKGRGPIQLTGRNNYRAAGNALGIDLENNPTRAADPDVGFRTAAWFWNSRNLNSYADAGNFDAITYRVNGGYNGKASRDAYYARALQVLGA